MWRLAFAALAYDDDGTAIAVREASSIDNGGAGLLDDGRRRRRAHVAGRAHFNLEFVNIGPARRVAGCCRRIRCTHALAF
jgi:hypothetical protein